MANTAWRTSDVSKPMVLGITFTSEAMGHPRQCLLCNAYPVINAYFISDTFDIVYAAKIFNFAQMHLLVLEEQLDCTQSQ